MRQMAADGVMQKDIMKVFGISQPYVSKIIRRKVWTHI
jgi:predicted XRE-type DNA-binding protein